MDWTIQVLLLPAGVLAVVAARELGRRTVLLQQGLSPKTAAVVLAEVAEIEEGKAGRDVRT